MEIKEFAEKFIMAEREAVQDGDFNDLQKLESPDIYIHMPPPLADVEGFEAHKQYLTNARQTNTVSQDWGYLAGDGHVGVLSLKEHVTLGSDFPSMGLTAGATIDFDGVFIIRLDDDHVVESWIQGNTQAHQTPG